MKKEEIFILCSKDGKRYKKKVNARTFEKDGIKFAIVGSSETGFNITHVETGMSITYASKMKDLINNIDEIVYKFKNMPPVFLENAQKLLLEAKESEVKK